MIVHRLLAFAPDGRRALFDVVADDGASLAANLDLHAGWAIRRLDGTALGNVASVSDERLWIGDPRQRMTLEDFDAAYPGLAYAPDPAPAPQGV